MAKDTRLILTDTREKTPWTFKRSKRATLKLGDYSIQRGTRHIIIERKSLIDLYVSLHYKRLDRFMRNMAKAVKTCDYVFIFVEANLSEIHQGIAHSRMPPEILLQHLVTLLRMGVQVIFTGGGKKGQEFAERILRTI